MLKITNSSLPRRFICVYIPSENLISQTYLTEIERWTKEQKSELNEDKTKVMISTLHGINNFHTYNKTIEPLKNTSGNYHNL